MRIGTPFYTTIFFVRAKKLCGASLHRPLVLDTIVDLYPRYFQGHQHQRNYIQGQLLFLKKELPDLKTKKSDKGKGFKELHIQIMLIKLWLRGIHHKCSPACPESYLNEYAFRFNNRNCTHGIFHGLLSNMMHHEPRPFVPNKKLCALIT